MAMIADTEKEKILLRDLNTLSSRVEYMKGHFTSNIRFCEELISHSEDSIIINAAKDRLEICEQAFEQMYGYSYREWYKNFDGRKPYGEN